MLRCVRDKVAIEGVVVLAEEHLLPVIATLRHVVRDAGNNGAGKAGHGGKPSAFGTYCELSPRLCASTVSYSVTGTLTYSVTGTPIAEVRFAPDVAIPDGRRGAHRP
jgi:hypothetical protein